VQAKELAVGDILLTPGHSLLWVGGNKPVIHNVASNDTRGVVQESSGDYFGLMNFANSPTKVRVYRTADADLATRAAAYARDWATERGSPEFEQAPVVEEDRVLKSPYCHARYSYAGERPLGSWTVASLFRVVKAIAYRKARQGLSPSKGVTCAQFITYCYQAASVERGVGSLLTAELLGHLRKDNRYLKLKHPEEANAIDEALKAIAVKAKDSLPPPLQRDAKTVLVGWLRQMLEGKDSGFNRVAYLSYSTAKQQAKLFDLSPGEQEADVTAAAVAKSLFPG